MSDNNRKSTCDPQAMTEFDATLREIDELLEEAKRKASRLFSEFDSAYEGEAKEEVLLFLNNLPKHIYRLQILYKKQDDFVCMTMQSFLQNDKEMVDKMGE